MIYTDQKRMVGDTLGELLGFGLAMGLRPELVQGWSNNLHDPHFNLTPELLAKALRRGAIVVPRAELVKIALDQGIDYENTRMLNEIFSPKNIPVLDGRTGQTEMAVR